MNAGLRNRLLAVWRKAIRCAAGVGYQDEVTQLLSEFRLTNIVDRWIIQFACYVPRCVKQEAPSMSCARLQWPAHRHCTRGQENSFSPFLANNRAGLVSFSNRARLIWNSLPADVREAPSLPSFKRRLLHILKRLCNLKGGVWSDRDTNDIFAHCSLIFHFLDFKFSNFICPSELHPLIWFFCKNSFGKMKNIRKTTKNALAPSIFIVLSIVLKLGTPLLHTQAKNMLIQIFKFYYRSRVMDEKPPKKLFYPTRSALMKHNFFRRSKLKNL